MEKPPLDPPVADAAPTELALTGYDEQHVITYLRLLDAEIDGADWREVAKVVLKIDPGKEPERARRAWESHLARARWMTKSGFKHPLRGGAPHLAGELWLFCWTPSRPPLPRQQAVIGMDAESVCLPCGGGG